MTIQELFIASNDALLRVIMQITDDQWSLDLPKYAVMKPSKLKTAVQYHTYDDAWVPDVLAGKTAADVGDQYEWLLASDDVLNNYSKYNAVASDVVRSLTTTDLDRIAHLSYGDFSVHDYLQHIVSFRAFRAYDFAKLIGVDATLPDDLVQALLDEFSPVIESYRQMGVFPPAVPVADDASPQAKLMGMAGRPA